MSFHTIFSVRLPDNVESIGYVEIVLSGPKVIGHGTVTSHSDSTVGANEIKLRVLEYVTVPLVISSGTVIERNKVEFSPGTVGSGEKDIDVNLKREPPFEQSDTLAVVRVNSVANRMKNDFILLYYIIVTSTI